MILHIEKKQGRSLAAPHTLIVGISYQELFQHTSDGTIVLPIFFLAFGRSATLALNTTDPAFVEQFSERIHIFPQKKMAG